ncbi:MAG: hypothetical protein ACKOBF_14500, partial [Limnohabitans sp.]
MHDLHGPDVQAGFAQPGREPGRLFARHPRHFLAQSPHPEVDLPQSGQLGLQPEFAQVFAAGVQVHGQGRALIALARRASEFDLHRVGVAKG